ncbi:MAG TPA: metalloregulator ArsR/SmtB family transcription factor [Victivallales bacterium]|nr:metalloregulator ArsR/SmtB family transcription factor [Victivallales bacterium]HPO90044.1 metalloregulator ArsR/SmtB family transcription factor [Victivallales bacterium]HRU02017.1 metalloregulator ArsR/SmtB family transcription factor [Victivallales bacterium]
MKNFILLARALSDPNRVKTLMAILRYRELCVCQIIEFLKLAPSTVSKHMFILRTAGLVESRKDGQWIYYKIPCHIKSEAKAAINWLESSLSKDSSLKRKISKLESNIKMKMEKKCKQRRKK